MTDKFPTRTIIRVANGYIVQTDELAPLEASHVFESIENALRYLAQEMKEKVSVHRYA